MLKFKKAKINDWKIIKRILEEKDDIDIKKVKEDFLKNLESSFIGEFDFLPVSVLIKKGGATIFECCLPEFEKVII